MSILIKESGNYRVEIKVKSGTDTYWIGLYHKPTFEYSPINKPIWNCIDFGVSETIDEALVIAKKFWQRSKKSREKEENMIQLLKSMDQVDGWKWENNN